MQKSVWFHHPSVRFLMQYTQVYIVRRCRVKTWILFTILQGWLSWDHLQANSRAQELQCVKKESVKWLERTAVQPVLKNPQGCQSPEVSPTGNPKYVPCTQTSLEVHWWRKYKALGEIQIKLLHWKMKIPSWGCQNQPSKAWCPVLEEELSTACSSMWRLLQLVFIKI